MLLLPGLLRAPSPRQERAMLLLLHALSKLMCVIVFYVFPWQPLQHIFVQQLPLAVIPKSAAKLKALFLCCRTAGSSSSSSSTRSYCCYCRCGGACETCC
jgi:hypothetical protein